VLLEAAAEVLQANQHAKRKACAATIGNRSAETKTSQQQSWNRINIIDELKQYVLYLK
jgi:hypothetical protein